MNTFVKLLNGDFITISGEVEKKDLRKSVFYHIKEYKKDEYKDLLFYQQIVIQDEEDEEDEEEKINKKYAFIRTLDTFKFKDVIDWFNIENFQELKIYIQYLAEKRMLMALSGGHFFELHFIDRMKNGTNNTSKTVCISKVRIYEINRTSKSFPFSRVILEDNDNLREYGYGFHLLDQFPIKLGEEVFYISTSLPRTIF